MIYIDAPKKYNNIYYSHMVSENLKELHNFASKIGIPRRMFHNPRGKNKPHYDVKIEFYPIAIANGALLTDSKEIVRILKENY